MQRFTSKLWWAMRLAFLSVARHTGDPGKAIACSLLLTMDTTTSTLLDTHLGGMSPLFSTQNTLRGGVHATLHAHAF